MGLIVMLNRLMKFGVEKEFFKIKPLGMLEKSCCQNSQVEVIDFDQTKEKLSSFIQLQQPKSADALKVLFQINQIDFIEMKRIEFFSLYTEDKIKFDLTEKIRESLAILFFLVHHKDFKLTNIEKQQYQQVVKNYIIVVNIDFDAQPITDRAITLAFLSMKRTIETIPASPLENFKNSKLLSCKQVDSYYKNLEEVRH